MPSLRLPVKYHEVGFAKVGYTNYHIVKSNWKPDASWIMATMGISLSNLLEIDLRFF